MGKTRGQSATPRARTRSKGRMPSGVRIKLSGLASSTITPSSSRTQPKKESGRGMKSNSCINEAISSEVGCGLWSSAAINQRCEITARQRAGEPGWMSTDDYAFKFHIILKQSIVKDEPLQILKWSRAGRCPAFRRPCRHHAKGSGPSLLPHPAILFVEADLVLASFITDEGQPFKILLSDQAPGSFGPGDELLNLNFRDASA